MQIQEELQSKRYSPRLCSVLFRTLKGNFLDTKSKTKVQSLKDISKEVCRSSRKNFLHKIRLKSERSKELKKFLNKRATQVEECFFF